MTKPVFAPSSPPDDDAMSKDEAALRCAVDILADSLDTGFMPSGLTLKPAARERHERTLRHFEDLLRQVQPCSKWARHASRALSPNAMENRMPLREFLSGFTPVEAPHHRRSAQALRRRAGRPLRRCR